MDWVKEEPEKDKDKDLPVEKEKPKDPSIFDQDYVRFGGQCPAPFSTTITIGSQSVAVVYDLKPFCDFALLVRPAVLALAYLSAMYIVSKAIRG